MSTPSAATTVQFTVPLQITVTLGAGDDTAAAPTVASAAVRSAAGAETLTAASEVDQGVLDEGLAILEANRDRTYYDATADAEAAAATTAASTRTAPAQRCSPSCTRC